MLGDDASALCERLRVLLDAANVDRVECDCVDLRDPDLRTIDALARLQLTAARRGRAVSLRGASPSLVELLALAGLTRILRSGVQVVRQAEHREEAGGIQEEGDAADPVA